MLHENMKQLLEELLLNPEYKKFLRDFVIHVFTDTGLNKSEIEEELDELIKILLSTDPFVIGTMLITYTACFPPYESSGKDSFCWEAPLLLISDIDSVEPLVEWDNICLEGTPEAHQIRWEMLSAKDIDLLLLLSPESLPAPVDYRKHFNILMGSKYLDREDIVLAGVLLVDLLAMLFHGGQPSRTPDEIFFNRVKTIPMGNSPEEQNFRRALLYSQISYYQSIRCCQKQIEARKILGFA